MMMVKRVPTKIVKLKAANLKIMRIMTMIM